MAGRRNSNGSSGDASAASNGKMKLLSRDEILGRQDMTYAYVDCSEWGGAVRVRGLLALERDAYESSLVLNAGTDNQRIHLLGARARMVAKCCVDEDGKRLFTDEDVDALGAKNAAPVDRLFDKIQELSGMTKAALEAKRKNSAAATSGGSASLSQ